MDTQNSFGPKITFQKRNLLFDPGSKCFNSNSKLFEQVQNKFGAIEEYDET